MKVKYIMILCCLVVTVLTACSGKSMDQERKTNAIYNEFNKATISNKGVLTAVEGVIWFEEFGSGERLVLCSKPDCMHYPIQNQKMSTSDCEGAYPVDLGGVIPFIYQEKLYCIYNKDLSTLVITESELFGGGRKVVTELPYTIRQDSSMILEEDTIYFKAFQNSFDEISSSINDTQFFLQYQMEDKKMTPLVDMSSYNKGEFIIRRITKNHLYYQIGYLEDGAVEPEINYETESLEEIQKKMYEFTIDYVRKELHSLDLTTLEDKVLVTAQEFLEDQSNVYDADDTYLYTSSGNDIVRVTPVTKEEEILWQVPEEETLESHQLCTTGNVMSTVKKGGGGKRMYYLYDYMKQQVMTCEHDSNPRIVWAFGDYMEYEIDGQRYFAPINGFFDIGK